MVEKATNTPPESLKSNLSGPNYLVTPRPIVDFEPYDGTIHEPPSSEEIKRRVAIAKQLYPDELSKAAGLLIAEPYLVTQAGGKLTIPQHDMDSG